MTSPPHPARPWWRWLALAGMGVVLAVAAVIWGVHSRPAKRAVLDWLIPRVEQAAGLRLEATSLDYNLFRLEAGLTNLRLATSDNDVPFLQAERVEARIPWSALRGAFSVEIAEATGIDVRILRRADGTTNLPAGRGTGTGEPRAIPLGRLRLNQLSFRFSDEGTGLSLALPNLAVEISARDGRIGLVQAGELRWRTTATPITELDGALRFDGRTVTVEGLRLMTGDLATSLGGTVAVFVGEPRLDLTVSATSDVPRLTRWIEMNEPPTGSITVAGTISGPLATPATALRVGSPSLSWRGLTAADVDAELAVDAGGLTLRRAEASAFGGRVRVSGTSSFEAGNTSLTTSWARLDVEALTRWLAPSLVMRPAARSSGTASVRGAGSEIGGWTIDAQSTLDSGSTAVNRVGIGGTLDVGLTSNAWRVDAGVTAGRVPLSAHLRGRLNARTPTRSTVEGDVVLPEGDVNALLDTFVSIGVVSRPGEAIAGVGTATVEVGGTLDSPTFRGTARVASLQALGLRNVDLDATGDGTLDALSFDLAARQAGTNALTARGAVRPRDSQLDARVTGGLGDLSALGVDSPVEGRLDVDLAMAGPFSNLGVTGQLRSPDARYGELLLGSLNATVDGNARSVRTDVQLERFRARATANIDLVARRARVDASTSDTDLALFVPPGTDVSVAGTLSLAATAEGPFDRFEDGAATVDVPAMSATVSEVAMSLATPARLSYANGTVDVGSLEAQLGELRASISGRLPVRTTTPDVPTADALRAVVTGNVEGLLRTVGRAGFQGATRLSGAGPLAVLARVTGSAERPVAEANVELGPATLTPPDLPPVTLLQVRARVDGQRLDVLDASGEWQGSRLTANGRMPLDLLSPYLPARLASVLPKLGEPATLSARAESITPEVLQPFVDAETRAQLGGRITASAELRVPTLTLDAVQGDVRLDQVDLVVATLPVTQSVPTHMSIDRGLARVEAWEWQAPDTTLRVGGQIRLSDRHATLLAGGRADLRLLAPFLAGTGVAATGAVEPRIAIVGPLETPIIEGELVLADAEARLASPRITATGLNALAILTPNGLRLTRLDGRVNGGVLSGGGSLDYSGQSATPAQLSASVRGMSLDAPAGLRSEIDADLALAVAASGADAPARGQLTGTVTVTRSAYREPFGVVTGLFAALRAREATRRETTAAPSGLERLDLDVRVVTDDDVVVRNNVAQARLGGDLRVIGTAAAPALSGRAMLREGGSLTFGRNRYTVDEGTIDFSNPTAIEPTLNVQAHTRAGGEDIELTLTGTPATLDVGLRSSSNPELGEADIASMLLTGRRLDQIPGAEARIVGEEVLGYLSGDVLGVAGRAVGLDAIRLGGVDTSLRRESATIATRADPTARMTVVKSIGDQLEVTLSQSLRSGDAQTWIVDYLPVRQVDLRLVSGDDSLRSYEMRHDVAVGSGAASPTRAAPRKRETQVVSSVRLSGSLVVPEVELRRELRLAPTRPFDPSTWQTDRDRLEARLERAGYREARVASTTTEGDDGVAIDYAIESGPRTVVRISGDESSPAIVRAIERAWADAFSDEALREDARRIVVDDLTRQGYRQATVDVTAEVTDAEKTLAITVMRGQRTPDVVVHVESEDRTLADDVARDVGEVRLRTLAQDGQSALADTLTSALRLRGHLRGRVSVSGPTFAGQEATWVARLVPGPRFTVGSTRVVVGDMETRDGLDELRAVGLAPSALFTTATLEAGQQAVVDVFRRRGYPTPRVVPRADLDDSTGLVAVTMAVEPGRRQVLERVRVEGAGAVRSDVVERAVGLTPGEPLPADAWLEARTRVFQTGLFRRVDISMTEAPSAEVVGDTPVDMRVTVQEWPALRLRYGLQVSEEWRDGDPLNGRNVTPGLSADATRRTVLGRAVTLGGAAIYRKDDRSARAFASTPTLWGRAIESAVTLQQSHTELPGDTLFVRDGTSIAWEQRARVASNLRLSYSYTFERNHTFDPAPKNPLLPTFDITENVARLVGTAAYDSRNDPLDAARGLLLSSGVEYAPEALGSTTGVHFIRSLTQAYYFKPWRGIVFASAARVGAAKGLGGVELIPSERFRAGGARSLRGVEEDGLGPRSALFGDAVGGDAMLVFNQEARFPIYRWLKGVAFADMGNVVEKPRDIRLGDLVGSSGLGLRLTTPFGLLRLDYGKLWTPTDTQRTGRWSFGIGQAF